MKLPTPHLSPRQRALTFGVGGVLAFALLTYVVLRPSGSDKVIPRASGAAQVTVPTAPGPTRWWSDSAGAVGSAIDVEQPEKDALSLHPDPAAYCAMLRSSISSPMNPLARQVQADQNLILATRAWAAEIGAMAPPSVAEAWKVLGPALVETVRPSASVSPAGGTSLNQAVAVIAQDAKDSCKLDLSKVPS